MNANLHMTEDLRNTNHGNFFVIFGESDIDILTTTNDQLQMHNVDIFHPNTGDAWQITLLHEKATVTQAEVFYRLNNLNKKTEKLT
ncbi:MAG: hypothetical protein FDX21_10600 [Chlorobium sp.]|nr:MAG: hypothetical protein FDX21_10600 [Chlorobium sp.]